jgi:regulator of sirC expression with transglutaminase-like and TPR domain
LIAPSPDLALFRHVVRRPEERIDLAHAALLVAEPHYPGLDVASYVGALDRLGDEARRRVAGERGDVPARRLARLLFDEVGFAGNTANYYDPRNSYLNEVLDRRLGIPITLSIVLLEVARRAGVEMHGVNFPGHFLVRAQGSSGPLFVDAFGGKLLDTNDLRLLHRRVTGGAGDDDPAPQLLEPTTKTQILARLLRNLREIHRSRGDLDGLRATLERLLVIAPDDEESERALERLAPSSGRHGAN